MKVRLRELERIFAFRWGATLPDDDAGRDDLLIIAHHIVRIWGDPDAHVRPWAAIWAPWIGEAECAALIERVSQKPLRWSADKLAWRLGLTSAERDGLRITTIGAIDMNRDQRAKRRKERKRAKAAARRRAGGNASRHDYEGNSLTHSKPWEALGMSRRTWYRKRKPIAK